MNRPRVTSPLFWCALGIVLLALFASTSSAGVIYEYRELGSIFPPNPDDPTIDRTLVFAFGAPAGGDSIGLASFDTFPDGSVVIGDLFLDGDWAAAPDAAVPEPGTLALLGMGVMALGRSVLRRRR